MMRDPADDFTPIELMFLARATVYKAAYNGLTADDEFVSDMEDSVMVRTIKDCVPSHN